MERVVGRSARLPLVTLTLLLAFGCSGDPEQRKRQFLESGQAYFAQEKYREAIVEYRNALQIDGRLAAARVGLAAAYERIGDHQNAFGEYVRAADLLPADDAIQLRAGEYLLSAGRFEDAKTKAEVVLSRDSRNVVAQVLLGNSLAGLKNIDQAVSEIEEAIRLDPLRGATFTNLGILELGRGRASAAEGAFLQSVAIDPTWVPGHLALANHYWSTGRTEDAERVLREALRIDPANTLANRAMAVFLISRGRMAEAEPCARVLAVSGAAPFATADLYLLQNKASEAVPELERLRATSATATAAAQRLASAYALRGDYRDALRVIDELLATTPADAGALLLKGLLLAREGKDGDALRFVEMAAKADPTSAPAHFALGRLLSAQGDQDSARQAFLEVVRLNPRAAGAQVELARLDLHAGRFGHSVQMAADALRSDPRRTDARLALATALTAKGDSAGAEKVLDEVPPANQNTPAFHVARARAYAAQRQVAAARQSYAHALILAPAAIDAVGGLVALDLEAGDTISARRRVDAAVAAHPVHAELLLLAARTYAVSRDLPGAERFLKKAVGLRPDLLTGYIMLGQIYFAQQRLDEARVEFATLAERQKKPVAALTMLGMIAQMQKDEAAAARHYVRALDLEPRAPIAANNLAWIYAERGENLETALHLAQVAADQLPQIPEIHDTLGWVQYRRQAPARAIEAFKTALRLAPGNPATHYRLALAHQQAGEFTLARTAAQQALTLNERFPEAADARTLLKVLTAGPSNPQ